MAHELGCLFVLHSYHHAVRFGEIIDSGAFLEEFRIAGHAEGNADAALVELFLHGFLHLGPGAHGHSALSDEKGVFLDVATELAGNFEHIAKVGRDVFIRRGAYGREDDIGIVDAGGKAGGEKQASCLSILQHHFLETRFIDGHDTLLEVLDFLFVDVYTGNGVTHFCEASATDQAYVACAYHCDIHIVCVVIL